MPKIIQEGLSFINIAERVSVTKNLILPLTRGWSVKFEASIENPKDVWVDFYYNGKTGRDENSSMSIKCNVSTVDSLFEAARLKASEDLKADKAKYKGCYGFGVYKVLSRLREEEAKKGTKL